MSDKDLQAKLTARGGVWNDVQVEMCRQDKKWGEQNHGDEIWLAVLTEEVGEVAKAILERRAEFDTRPFSVEMRVEVVQCAAVCLQWLSALDRRAQIGPWGVAP